MKNIGDQATKKKRIKQTKVEKTKIQFTLLFITFLTPNWLANCVSTYITDYPNMATKQTFSYFNCNNFFIFFYLSFAFIATKMKCVIQFVDINKGNVNIYSCLHVPLCIYLLCANESKKK